MVHTEDMQRAEEVGCSLFVCAGAIITYVAAIIIVFVIVIFLYCYISPKSKLDRCFGKQQGMSVIRMSTSLSNVCLMHSFRLSLHYTMWGTVAIIHFFQYVRSNSVVARKILTWISRRLEVHVENERSKNQSEEEEDLTDVNDKLGDSSLPSGSSRGEECALCVVGAYCWFDRGDLNQAAAYASQAVEYDSLSSFAHRAVGLIAWYQGRKQEAIECLTKAQSLCPSNPYVLKSVAIVFAIDQNFMESISLLESALAISPNSSGLAWRALGTISYLYGTSDQKQTCVDSFDRAFHLSNNIDFEAGLLKAQVLMDNSRYEDAKVILRSILPLNPCDSVALCCLAVCVASTNTSYEPSSQIDDASNIEKVYELKLSMMDSPLEFVASEDPLALFEASVNRNLAKIFLEKRKNTKFQNALSRGWSIIKNISADADAGANTGEVDVPPHILFWYGMYCLHKGGATYVRKARELFVRASHRSDSPPYPLAVYMLGWISEMKRDMRGAERYYAYILQFEPMTLVDFLRLARIVREAQSYIK